MKKLLKTALFCLLVNSAGSSTPCPAQDVKKKSPVLIDTDFGSDIDDAYALALALASPELDVRGVTTVGKQAMDRAWMVCRFLAHSGRGDIPVAAGAEQAKSSGIDWQIQYRRHPAVVFNRAGKPSKGDALELISSAVGNEYGQTSIITLGPLTNIANYLEKYPLRFLRIKQLIIMGGSFQVGYSGKPPAEVEWNIATDPEAARKVFQSGIPITLIPLDASATVKLEQDRRRAIFSAHTPLTFQVHALHELWGQETPVLFDPVAVAAAFNETFCRFEKQWLTVDEKGMTRAMDKPPAGTRPDATPSRVAVSIDREKFLAWFTARLAASGKPVLPEPPKNPSRLVERGNFPARVHVVEDYDTDIEKRWWMAGRLEQKDVPPGGRRACRATLTQDFDDRQGDLKTMYRAVIFNPVPGPPMGPNTRLTFRYKLTGTNQLRVQLYSLSKGYHRYLSVSGLPTGRWETATVDMTQMRRPDGTGGPLAADERIDDIQFYIDPRGELLIDDLILYDAAAPGEKRPFPRRVVFTGGFDTGKQGQEWPGVFEIVPHKPPLTWKHARSVLAVGTNPPVLTVGLRGERRLDGVTEVTFRYRLTGADTMRVELHHMKTGWKHAKELRDLRRDDWATTTARFDTAPEAGKPDRTIDHVRFVLPPGSELGLDDLLVYTPEK